MILPQPYPSLNYTLAESQGLKLYISSISSSKMNYTLAESQGLKLVLHTLTRYLMNYTLAESQGLKQLLDFNNSLEV